MIMMLRSNTTEVFLQVILMENCMFPELVDHTKTSIVSVVQVWHMYIIPVPLFSSKNTSLSQKLSHFSG